MIETLAVQKLLNQEFARCKAVNPRYSLRSLARKLKVSPASLSLLMNGRRPATRKFASSLCRSLHLDPQQEHDLLALFSLQSDRRPVKTNELQLKSDQFRMISDWYYFAILSLLETHGSTANPSWIASRLGLGAKLVADALDRMGRLGLIEVGENGEFKLTGVPVSTTDEIASAAIRQSHSQLLNIAQSSLENDPLELRDFLSATMAIDPAKLPHAKHLLREFRQRLCEFLESGQKTEVYALTLQLIPLSKNEA